MNAVIAKAAATLLERMHQAEREERELQALQIKAQEVALTAQLRGESHVYPSDLEEVSDSGEQIIACIQVSSADETANFTLHTIRQAMEGYFSDVTVPPNE